MHKQKRFSDLSTILMEDQNPSPSFPAKGLDWTFGAQLQCLQNLNHILVILGPIKASSSSLREVIN